MAHRAEVPPNPLVLIDVDFYGRLTINGHYVQCGRRDPRVVATDVVRCDFASPLGRPVRALATLPDEQIRLVIHPDGSVTDVEPHSTATPAGVPPATRVPGWLTARDAERVAAEITAARHAGRRRRSPVVIAGALAGALAVAAAALVVAWDQLKPAPEVPASAGPTDPAAEVAPVQPVVESTRLRPFAVSEVSAAAGPGVLRLEVAAQRPTLARVVVTPLAGAGTPERLTLAIRGATTRLVTLPALAPGRYQWQVLVPGQPPHSGVTKVPGVPAPVEVATVQVTPEAPAETPDEPAYQAPAADTPVETPAETPAGGNGGTQAGGAGQDDPPQVTGVGDGPNHPVDPDGD